MKTIKSGIFTFILVMLAVSPLFVSCDKDEDEDAVDKTELLAAIEEAEALIETAVEGTAEGQYLPGSKDELQTVVDAAQTVYDDDAATQTDVDNTVIAVDAAIDEFESNIVEAIAPEALSGHWTFNEGSGTTLTDFSGNAFDGTLMDGSATWGGGLPQWTTDRYGNEGGALAFDEGSHVVIPYNNALNAETMSISVWLNASEVLENNRFIGLHSWLGYKFQLQSANKAFFTINASEGIYDRDTDPELDIETWYHVVVTFGDGNMTFYVNGTKTQTWDNTPGTAVANTGNDLVFGQGSDVYAADDSNYSEDQIIPLAWGGYFHGMLDDVRIYSTVLSDAQVQSIYELEKVPE